MINPLKRLSALCRVPDDLDAVTDIGDEEPETRAGLRAGSVTALWRRVERLYATGIQPGIQLCVRHGGKLVLNRALGHARGNEPGSRDPRPVPMKTGTPVNLFSAAKPVTALLMHKLEELGHLGLDDRVADHIPGFERYGKQHITIRQVMTHRAGLQHFPGDLAKAFESGVVADPRKVLEMILELRPQGRIGGAPAYHTLTGGFILVEVMRRATGREPRELLRTLIKEPLGLRWLDYGVQGKDLDKVARNALCGYMPGPIAWQLGRIIGMPYDRAVGISNDDRFLTAVIPSGNVITTARDTAILYQCLLNDGVFNGRRVFRNDIVARATVPDRRRASFDRTIGMPIRYSSGFMLGHGGLGLYGWNRHHTFGHLGLSMTFTWARPDTGTVIALLTNGKPILGPHMREIVAVCAGFNALCENRIVASR